MSKVYLFPISVFIVFHFTFIGTYIIACVLEGHFVPAALYISDAVNSDSPEIYVFGQFVNIGCVLVGIVFYIRYRQIQQLIYHHSDLESQNAKWNTAALWAGICAAVGCSVAANSIQETNVRVIHIIGVLVCFGMATIYFWIQTLMSYRVRHYCGSIWMSHFRLILAVFCMIFLISATVTAIISYSMYRGDNPRKWYPADGWEFRLASSVSEWALACVFSFFILSFTREFQLISINHPTVVLAGYERIQFDPSSPDAMVF